MANNSITSNDNVELFVRDWPASAASRKRGSVLILHGLGEHCGRYEEVAGFLNELGFDVRSYDHRGHGQSKGKRGVIGHTDALTDDARLVFEDFSRGRDDTPFLLGHSMGGAVALRAAVDGVIKPRGLILSSPAVTAKLSFVDKIQLALGRLTPNVAVSNKLNPDYVSRDRAVVEAYRNDPLVHDRITPRLANFILDSGQIALSKAAQFKTPTLLLVAGDDRLVDHTGTLELASRLPSASTTLRVYDDCYHEIFNELTEARAVVLGDLKDWLNEESG